MRRSSATPETDRTARAGSTLVALVAAVLAVAGAGLVRGDDQDQAKTRATERPKAQPRSKPVKDLTDAEAEAAALAFVRENHPELAALLAQLKPMNPGEYDRAVRELAQVSRSLAEIKTLSPKRYETGLAVWKARSRVDLLAARLAGAREPAPSADQEDQLRQAVAALVDAEIRQQRVEKETVQERLRKLEKSLENLESRHDSVVENRYQALLKKSQRARRKSAAGAKPGDRPAARPAVTGKANANTNANVNSGADRGAGPQKKGERQP